MLLKFQIIVPWRGNLHNQYDGSWLFAVTKKSCFFPRITIASCTQTCNLHTVSCEPMGHVVLLLAYPSPVFVFLYSYVWTYMYISTYAYIHLRWSMCACFFKQYHVWYYISNKIYCWCRSEHQSLRAVLAAVLSVKVWMVRDLWQERVLLCIEPDGRRSAACGRSRFLRWARQCVSDGQTVRTCTETAAFAKQHRDLTPREGHHQGEKILEFVLGSTCHPRWHQTT